MIMNRLQRWLVWWLACLMAQPSQITLAQALDFPVVVERTINNGDAQRSTVTNVSLRFNSSVSVAAADLLLRNLNTGLPLDPTNFVATYDPATNRATWTFPGLAGSSLPDGNYLATLRATSVTNTTGQPLDGNADGLPGDGYSFGLFRSFGDFDGDRDVDFHDNDWFRRTWLKSAGDSLFDVRFDANGDGKVAAAELPRSMARVLELGDENKDGSLDDSEAKRFAEKYGSISRPVAKEQQQPRPADERKEERKD
jgi:hypothetical protein